MWIKIDGSSYTSPAIGKDGTIYVNDASGTLYAFGKKAPDPPLLCLEEEGDCHVVLNWSFPEETGLPNYSYIPLPPELLFVNIYRNRTGTPPRLLTTINLSLDNSSTYRDEDVLNGVGYTYSITSVSIYGESDRSNMVTAIPRTVPDAPLNLKAVEGNGFVNLSWEAPLDDGGAEILRYTIRRTEFGETFRLLGDVDSSVLYFNDTSAVNGIVYEYDVHAVNSAGFSQPVRIIAGPKTFPDNPVVDVISGDSRVTLSWDDPDFDGGSDILGFRVYKKENDQINMIAELEDDVHEYVDDDVINGNVYRYAVTAFNDMGESVNPLFYEVVPRGVPSPPTDLEGRSGDGYVHLSWSEPSDDNGSPLVYYLLEVSADLGGEPFRESYWIDPPSTEYVDTDVIKGIEYTYTVKAVNSVGESR
ncbi:MAG: hypothetical protein DRN57_08955, partial [Thermoplasmata archaeon]